ncbi:DUF1203 domain-containing protein [Pseudoroseicyclus aestuarii]|uniref:Uncharacterized protein DUF1203 n=1 Tax=Pseudoroseicyclus aestuarii TaxID=1795041 RepID=A0A318SYK0_9RHOB|nr:DUF1203 domain-containing protein [Pseudoroseicyclus aestuarii]PYE85436.1 uncharacterized protein DUF1203 [Pseudoroseicyclus aestuarii]
MSYRIEALPAEPFAPLFALSKAELEARSIRRMRVTAKSRIPCHVSLQEAQPGETVLLLNHEHQPAKSPYRASHAIYVPEGARQAAPFVGAVPAPLQARLISLRPFDKADMMQGPEVVEGGQLYAALRALFAERDDIAYVQLHYAKAGCFAATAWPEPSPPRT